MQKIDIKSNRVLANKGLNGAAHAALVCHEVKKVIKLIFPKDLSKEVDIISFRDKTLLLSASSSIYLQEINLKESEIMGKTNTALGSKAVERIKFKHAPKRDVFK